MSGFLSFPSMQRPGREGADVQLKQVRRRCEAKLLELGLTAPFDVYAFCRSLGARRGRPIHLRPVSAPTGPCGLWIARPGADYIFYEEQTSRLHQEHIILHELAHLIWEHGPTPVLDHEVARLLPDLDPQMLRRILGRTRYSALEEQHAEVLASLILQWANRRSPEPTWEIPLEASAIVGRLGRSLERLPADPHD
jgi:hypothetical protein